MPGFIIHDASWNAAMRMAFSFINHVLLNLGAAKNVRLTVSLSNSTKHDIAEIAIFFTELFEADFIRGYK